MSEKTPDKTSHRTALEIGGALGVASASAAAYYIWHRYHEQERSHESLPSADVPIFEDTRLTEEQRELVSKLGASVYLATRSSVHGGIMLSELTHVLHVRRHAAQYMLGYLMPMSSHEWDRPSAYIDRRPRSIDHRTGYYALARLIELAEVGGSPNLDRAITQLAPELVDQDITGNLYNLPRNLNLPPTQDA